MIQAPSNDQIIMQMTVGNWITQGISVAAELGIADELAAGPLTTERLAERTHANPEALYRLMRALASMGIFAQDENGAFTLTPLAERLLSNTPGSKRSFARMCGAEFYEAWGNLLYSVQTGEAGFRKTYGKSFFEYMTEHPDRHAIYDEAMNGVHGGETEPMVEAYDFSQFETVVDVGGGNGLTMIGILKRYPSVRGIVFELPSVAERARKVIRDEGLSDRCEAVGGDFLSSVPSADAYVLRHVLHDWKDDDAAVILHNCRKAMKNGGKVLAVETVIPNGNHPSFGKWIDLMMLLVEGVERTEDQYRRLFERGGLTLSRIVPTAHEVSIIEGLKAE